MCKLPCACHLGTTKSSASSSRFSGQKLGSIYSALPCPARSLNNAHPTWLDDDEVPDEPGPSCLNQVDNGACETAACGGWEAHKNNAAGRALIGKHELAKVLILGEEKPPPPDCESHDALVVGPW